MPPLSKDAINILKTTAPVVQTEGSKITTRMYEILFTNHPNVKNLFNASHFVRAEETHSVAPQAQALANAVFAYAANVDNLGALGGAVAKMAHKHVSFDVQPEHYAIVGECLLQAMKDVLGDAATDDVMAGWKEAYEFLADLLIGIEGGLKTQNSEKKGGWSGFTPLVVAGKIRETEDVYSFHLKKPDGSDLPGFKPGQYLSFRIPKGEIDGFDFDVVRNYSISNKPGESNMRISVKREKGSDGSPAGAASNYLHDKVDVGSLIEVGMPCGTFVLKEDNDRPIVLIAGGIGVTPMVSMVDYIKGKENESRVVTFVECAKSEAENPMRSYIDSITDGTTLISHAFYTGGEQAESFQNTKIQYGRMQKDSLAEVVPSPADGNEYYVCGPPSFLKNIVGYLTELGIPAEQINHEYFGPTLH